MSRCYPVALALTLLFSPSITAAAPPAWKAGVARVVITPEQPMWMSGYGGRDHAAEGKVHDLWAKAVALRDPAGKTVVFVSTDLITVPIKMVKAVMAQVSPRHGLGRGEVMFTCSHTHCGPAVDDMLSYMLAMKEKDWKQVRAYQQVLNALAETNHLMQQIEAEVALDGWEAAPTTLRPS